VRLQVSSGDQTAGAASDNCYIPSRYALVIQHAQWTSFFLFGLGVTRIHRDPNFIAILQAKARRPLDENRVADGQRLGKLSVDAFRERKPTTIAISKRTATFWSPQLWWITRYSHQGGDRNRYGNEFHIGRGLRTS
jgi:hypothetical protein